MDTDEQLKQLEQLKWEVRAARQEQKDNTVGLALLIFAFGGGAGMLAGLPWALIIPCAICIGLVVLLACIISRAVKKEWSLWFGSRR